MMIDKRRGEPQFDHCASSRKRLINHFFDDLVPALTFFADFAPFFFLPFSFI